MSLGYIWEACLKSCYFKVPFISFGFYAVYVFYWNLHWNWEDIVDVSVFVSTSSEKQTAKLLEIWKAAWKDLELQGFWEVEVPVPAVGVPLNVLTKFMGKEDDQQSTH